MPFNKGKSGNKNGRPPNTGHRQKLFNSLVVPHKEALITKAIEMAMSGNEQMLRLFLQLMLPVKPTDEPIADFTLPDVDMTKGASLISVGAEILKGISNKHITPEQGKELISILETQRKLIETTELAARLTEVEHILKKRKS